MSIIDDVKMHKTGTWTILPRAFMPGGLLTILATGVAARRPRRQFLSRIALRSEQHRDSSIQWMSGRESVA